MEDYERVETECFRSYVLELSVVHLYYRGLPLYGWETYLLTCNNVLLERRIN